MPANYTFGFEKLKVWQLSRSLSVDIYRLTAKDSFPNEEKFNLVSQMRRSAISISSNIAEGTSRFSNKDKSRFLTIAYGSSMELINQLIVSCDLEFIKESELENFRKIIYEIAAMLSGLKKSFEK